MVNIWWILTGIFVIGVVYLGLYLVESNSSSIPQSLPHQFDFRDSFPLIRMMALIAGGTLIVIGFFKSYNK